MRWTLETIQQEALKYKTRWDFQKKGPRAYKAAYRKGLLERVCKHMDSAQLSWPTEAVRIEALKYKSRSEFREKCSGAYRAALRLKIIDEVCQHMKTIYVNWTNDLLGIEALKYNTKKEFKKNNESAYVTAFNKGILDQVCAHMQILYIDWTLETLQEEALKYESRGEFQKNSSAHLVASRRGVLEQICTHMKLSRCSSVAEKELFSIIKGVYPESKKIRDMNVSVPNKPYIQGFEIDILVGSLGIEFDGKYYHSFKKMRKDPSKALWSDDDIRNYHRLKDDWFASKGVLILHIKEEEWNLNKEACIDKCLIFLGTK